VPTALTFFAGFGTENIQLNIAADRYISFVLSLIVGAGLVFELPMIAFFLTKLGILTPAFMRHYRRHAIVVILIIAAVVTPTPDIVTQSFLRLRCSCCMKSVSSSRSLHRKKNRKLPHEATQSIDLDEIKAPVSDELDRFAQHLDSRCARM